MTKSTRIIRAAKSNKQSEKQKRNWHRGNGKWQMANEQRLANALNTATLQLSSVIDYAVCY